MIGYSFHLHEGNAGLVFWITVLAIGIVLIEWLVKRNS
jgi:hypothetical protein